MLTAIVYNCDPESLADMDQSDFADAFENEIRDVPRFVDLRVLVTFSSGKSGITSFSSDDWEDDVRHEEEFREKFHRLAERAFSSLHR